MTGVSIQNIMLNTSQGSTSLPASSLTESILLLVFLTSDTGFSSLCWLLALEISEKDIVLKLVVVVVGWTFAKLTTLSESTAMSGTPAVVSKVVIFLAKVDASVLRKCTSVPILCTSAKGASIVNKMLQIPSSALAAALRNLRDSDAVTVTAFKGTSYRDAKAALVAVSNVRFVTPMARMLICPMNWTMTPEVVIPVLTGLAAVVRLVVAAKVSCVTLDCVVEAMPLVIKVESPKVVVARLLVAPLALSQIVSLLVLVLLLPSDGLDTRAMLVIGMVMALLEVLEMDMVAIMPMSVVVLVLVPKTRVM